MNTKDQIIAEVLQRGFDDWVYLAEVSGIVHSQLASPDIAGVMPPTIEVIEELLNNGLVEVGDLVGSGSQIRFQPWEVSVHEALAEIEKRWLEYGGPLGRDGANDVCWISNTEKGDELAQRNEQQEPLA